MPFSLSTLPATNKADIAPEATSITKEQMAMLVNYVLRENSLPQLGPGDQTAAELFNQLRSQNALSQS